MQGHVDGAAAALAHQIQAVVEELAEEGEHRVERGRQAGVGRHVGNETGLARGQALAVVATSLHRRRIVRRLVHHQVAGDAGLGVVDGTLLGRVGGRGAAGRPEQAGIRVGRSVHLVQEPGEHLIGAAEVFLAGLQVVARSVDGAQTVGEHGAAHLVGPGAEQGRAGVGGASGSVGLGDADLGADEPEILCGQDESSADGGGRRDPPRVEQNGAGQGQDRGQQPDGCPDRASPDSGARQSGPVGVHVVLCSLCGLGREYRPEQQPS